MKNFTDYIENTYHFPLSIPDQEALHTTPSSELEALQKKIERKYEIGAKILSIINTPLSKRTITQLLRQSLQSSMKGLTRMSDLTHLKQSGHFDDDLFDKYHRKLLNHTQLYQKLIELVNQAKEQSFEPADFRKYLQSGLFDQGIYKLQRRATEEELQAVLNQIQAEIQIKYDLELCKKDQDFILNNQVQNNHIITQIVVPKYRLAQEIIQLLGGHYMDDVIQMELERGMNEGVPILKRFKALAEWYNGGYLSKVLVKKFHYQLIHDLDELEEFFLFLEKISEYISKDRAIHYMELGLYEVFDEKHFENLLRVEQSLYDISDYIEESVGEYIRIMQTPASGKGLITNRRLVQCFEKFINALDLLFKHRELFGITKHLPKLQQFQNGFARLFQDYYRKNHSLPTQKPYKAIEYIRPFSKVFFTIESENLLRMSMAVLDESQHAIQQQEYLENSTLIETVQQFQLRVQAIQEAYANPKLLTEIISRLLPLENTHTVMLNEYLRQKN
ncbi:MAG: hypothetical protein HQM14_05750 [SAR324 cluster bacterium]|nr:hypothetical protein [SAR324 cluster bacterium]